MKSHISSPRRCFSLQSATSVTCGLFLSSAALCPGAIFIQELFDGIAGPPPGANMSLNGRGDTTTTVGLAGTWAGGTSIYVASNFNVTEPTLPGLAPSNGVAGGVWNNNGGYATNIYATRELSNSIDFSVARTLFFSVRLNNSGDTAVGIGLASGAGGSSEFVGAGLTWNTASSIGGTNANNTSYIGHGNLDASGGVYGIRAHDTRDSINGRGLIVGRITINASGADLIDIKRYSPGSTLDSDPSSVTWSASSSVDSFMLASHLVLWTNGQNGGGSGEVDAIRFGDSWADVTMVPEPGSVLLGMLGMLPLLRRRR